MDNEVKDLETRVLKLEEWRINVLERLARDEVDKDYIKKQFEELQGSIKEFKEKIASQSNRLLWAIATPVITTAVVALIMGKFIK